MSKPIPKRAVPWLTGSMKVAGTLSLAGFLMLRYAPDVAKSGLAAAQRVVCQDSHVAYSDPKQRTKECLRRTLSKVEHGLAKHGVHSQDLDALTTIAGGD